MQEKFFFDGPLSIQWLIEFFKICRALLTSACSFSKWLDSLVGCKKNQFSSSMDLEIFVMTAVKGVHKHRAHHQDLLQ
jgi:hypothetical protein